MALNKVPGRVRIVADAYAEAPTDDIVKITYMSRSRYVLGTEAVDETRAHELQQMLERGDVVGVPVYAYVHSGSTIQCSETGNPFACPWDSARSGLAYMTWADAVREGPEGVSDSDLREWAKDYIRCVVKVFDDYLTGACYGYVVENAVEDPLRPGEQLLDEYDVPVFDDAGDSCWGFYGRDYKTNGIKDHVQSYLDRGYAVVEV